MLRPPIPLNSELLYEIVRSGAYNTAETSPLVRCTDGRYPSADIVPACAFPGADMGFILLLLGYVRSYGVDLDLEKVPELVADACGGWEMLRFHAHCEEEQCVYADPQAYYLSDTDVKLAMMMRETCLNKGAQEVVLTGFHEESAIVIVEGDKGLFPVVTMDTQEGEVTVCLAVYQQSFSLKKMRSIAQSIFKKKAIQGCDYCDEEYVYQGLADVAETYLYTSLQRVYPHLPLFGVKINDLNEISVSDWGEIQKVPL